MRPRQSPYLIAALLLALLFFAGCSPAKKTLKEQQAYRALIDDYIRNNPPVIDTNTIYLPGKIDTIPVVLVVTDSTALDKAKDSLQALFAIKYLLKDFDCTRQVNEAFDTGYKLARDEMSKQKIVKPRPDTIKITTYPVVLIGKQQDKIKQLEGQLIESRNTKSWLWYFIGSAFTALILLFLLIKNSTAKK